MFSQLWKYEHVLRNRNNRFIGFGTSWKKDEDDLFSEGNGVSSERYGKWTELKIVQCGTCFLCKSIPCGRCSLCRFRYNNGEDGDSSSVDSNIDTTSNTPSPPCVFQICCENTTKEQIRWHLEEIDLMLEEHQWHLKVKQRVFCQKWGTIMEIKTTKSNRTKKKCTVKFDDGSEKKGLIFKQIFTEFEIDLFNMRALLNNNWEDIILFPGETLLHNRLPLSPWSISSSSSSSPLSTLPKPNVNNNNRDDDDSSNNNNNNSNNNNNQFEEKQEVVSLPMTLLSELVLIQENLQLLVVQLQQFMIHQQEQHVKVHDDKNDDPQQPSNELQQLRKRVQEMDQKIQQQDQEIQKLQQKGNNNNHQQPQQQEQQEHYRLLTPAHLELSVEEVRAFLLDNSPF